jgi:hypothetical protein
VEYVQQFADRYTSNFAKNNCYEIKVKDSKDLPAIKKEAALANKAEIQLRKRYPAFFYSVS